MNAAERIIVAGPVQCRANEPSEQPNMSKDEVATLMVAEAKRPPAPDRLEKLQAAVRELRNVEMERKSLEERQAELGKRVHELKTKTIIDLFDQARVDTIGVPEEGNLPRYDMEVGWHYHANLSNSTDEAEALKWLRAKDPDLLKTTFTISFGLGEGKKMAEFEKLLKKQKIGYSTSFGVPWNTLTAWVKGQYESKKTVPLKLLGATVERTAKLVKPRSSRTNKAAPKSTARKGK